MLHCKNLGARSKDRNNHSEENKPANGERRNVLLRPTFRTTFCGFGDFCSTGFALNHFSHRNASLLLGDGENNVFSGPEIGSESDFHFRPILVGFVADNSVHLLTGGNGAVELSLIRTDHSG